MKKVKRVIEWLLGTLPATTMFVAAAIAIIAVGIVVAVLRFFYMTLFMITNALMFFLNPLFSEEEKMNYASLDAAFSDYGRLMRLLSSKITFPEDL